MHLLNLLDIFIPTTEKHIDEVTIFFFLLHLMGLYLDLN